MSTPKACLYYYDYVFIKKIKKKTGTTSREPWPALKLVPDGYCTGEGVDGAEASRRGGVQQRPMDTA
ncbi:MAG: hypothetical protein EON54_23285 [Alcaligenaceae bacterium]|nr:MAG: hypothetical protein EON54_23285 [Alcaligenaceae bacterium]